MNTLTLCLLRIENNTAPLTERFGESGGLAGGLAHCPPNFRASDLEAPRFWEKGASFVSVSTACICSECLRSKTPPGRSSEVKNLSPFFQIKTLPPFL